MLAIEPLLNFDPARLAALIAGGYTSAEKYAVEREESDSGAAFRLGLLRLEQPYHKVFEVLEEDLERYQEVARQGFSLAAYAGEQLAGAAVAEVQAWNRALLIWEFHVAPAWRGQGLGRRLMDAVAQKAAAAGLRVLVCETQNTNVPAIRFYRKLGFRLEGIDLSCYTNTDFPDGEIALFMKRALTPGV